MKNYKFLIVILLFSLKGYTQQYGNWVRSNCYSFIETRIKFEESYPVSNGKFTERNVLVQIKNNSSKRIVLAYHISINKDIKQVYKIVNGNLQIHNFNSSYSGSTGVLEIDPHQTITDGMHMINIQDNQTLWIEISCIKEYNNDNKTLKQYYTRCDNGNLCSACQFSSTSSCDDDVNSNHSQNSTGLSGTSSMNRGGNVVSSNSNTQIQNNPQEEIVRQQQEKIRLQQEKTNQEVEKANQQLAEIKRRKEDAIKLIEQESQEQLNKNLENTTNVINSSVTNAINKSQINKKNNNQEILETQEEFSNYDLSDSEIDSLLNNSTPDKYATIHLYNLFKGRGIGLKFYTFINGYKAPALIKNQKIEHRIYIGNKLTIQFYATGFGGTSDLTTYNARIRKGKTYYFVIRREGNYPIIEEVETPPTDEKIENLSIKVKSDLEN